MHLFFFFWGPCCTKRDPPQKCYSPVPVKRNPLGNTTRWRDVNFQYLRTDEETWKGTVCTIDLPDGDLGLSSFCEHLFFFLLLFPISNSPHVFLSLKFLYDLLTFEATRKIKITRKLFTLLLVGNTHVVSCQFFFTPWTKPKFIFSPN